MDQMHLLALADTVASCNVDFADRFDINKAKEAMAKETYSRSTTDEPSMGNTDIIEKKVYDLIPFFVLKMLWMIAVFAFYLPCVNELIY